MTSILPPIITGEVVPGVIDPSITRSHFTNLPYGPPIQPARVESNKAKTHWRREAFGRRHDADLTKGYAAAATGTGRGSTGTHCEESARIPRLARIIG